MHSLAETHIIPLIVTQHSDLPPDLLPVLGLFCCSQTLSGRKVEIGRVEQEKARQKGAEMAPGTIPFRG